MASMVDIKRRMKSIKGTQQMTKAMNLVASAKLGRAKEKLSGSRPFNKESYRIMSNLLNDKINHPFFTEKEGNTIFIVITSDRGLCGGYNSNAIRVVDAEVKKQGLNPDNVFIYAVGKRCKEVFTKRNSNMLDFNVGVSEKPTYIDAKIISEKVINEYNQNRATKVVLVYTYFETIISHLPIAKTLLPINSEDFKDKSYKGPKKDIIIYEPGKEALLNYLLPKYITTQIYDALAESATCEQGARMTSMDNATKNAKEVLGNMTLLYNRARQAAITQEISEIVGGANAIQGG